MSKPGTRLVGTPLTPPSRPVLGTLVGTATGMGTGRLEIAAAAELASGAGMKGETLTGEARGSAGLERARIGRTEIVTSVEKYIVVGVCFSTWTL